MSQVLISAELGDLPDADLTWTLIRRWAGGPRGLECLSFIRLAHGRGISRKHPRVVCPPRLGSATGHARAAMANLAARNVAAVLAGAQPITPVAR